VKELEEKPMEGRPVTSSVPLKLPLEQQSLFREVLSLFEEQRLRYAVAGGFALQQHTGICRFTKDLDVFLSPAEASSALRLLWEKRFECQVCDPVWLAKAYRDDFFVDLITGMSNGAITVDNTWIERSRPALILGVKSRVLAPEELIASKLFILRRERFDGADIVHIIYALRGKLDWDRILELAGDHWELVLWALLLFRYVYPAQSNVIPRSLWYTLLSRFANEIRSPNPNTKFRGSLIDDRMFAIDVEEWGLENLLTEFQARRQKIRPLPASPRRRSAA
jgi:hypothetical protein